MTYRQLARAAADGDADVVRALLAGGLHPDVAPPGGGRKRALHQTLTHKGPKGVGHQECVRLLAGAGADLAREGQFQVLSPLRLAAAGGHLALIETLLDVGAPVSPCDAAAIHHQGPPTGDDSEGRSPLCALAASRLWHRDPAGAERTARQLLAAGATVDAPLDHPRVRPLWWLVAWGRNPTLLPLLLDAGASPLGCLADAAYMGLDGFITTLVARGANLEERTAAQLTPLLHALVFKRYTSVPLLLELGADTAAETPRALDALAVAERTKAPADIIERLSR